MSHTKGPLETLRHHVTGAIERGEKQAIISQPSNAQLIAAAPEMLEALQDAESLLNDCPDLLTRSSQARETLKILRAALKKAKGQK